MLCISNGTNHMHTHPHQPSSYSMHMARNVMDIYLFIDVFFNAALIHTNLQPMHVHT